MAKREIDREGNAYLDRVIEDRRTVRAFTGEAPPREHIEAVVRAGLLAPFSPMSVSPEELFRRFVIMEAGSRERAEAVDMIRRKVIESTEALSQAAAANPDLARMAQAFIGRLSAISSGAEIGIESAPFYIIVAEKKGFPPVELRSLAHCMENMWLKATALGLGFRLISATSQMADDEEFCRLIGIPAGEFGFDGCVVGYPAQDFPPTGRPPFDQAVKWLG
jgi:nitroreductase